MCGAVLVAVPSFSCACVLSGGQLERFLHGAYIVLAILYCSSCVSAQLYSVMRIGDVSMMAGDTWVFSCRLEILLCLISDVYSSGSMNDLSALLLVGFLFLRGVSSAAVLL